MSDFKLDQIVKGTPSPNVSAPAVAVAAAAAADSPPADPPGINKAPPIKPKQPSSHRHTPSTADPTTLLPSSPPRIYLNLLILEASLRSQYLTLRARRRQNTFFLLLLFLWNSFFAYLLYLCPREDGRIGGSEYWVVDTAEKVSLLGGVVVCILFWGTGQFERGVRWPRRWIGITNRGLRGMNCKIVILKGPWWREWLSHLSFLLPNRSLFPGEGSSYHYVPPSPSIEKRGYYGGNGSGRRQSEVLAEEDISPSGNILKLLLLPKPFSPDFRQNWEDYRTEYWERENERRAELRKRVKARQREIAKSQSPYLWWTGWTGFRWGRRRCGGADLEKVGVGATAGHAHTHSLAHQASLKEKKRRPSEIRDRERDRSHSRSSSRASTTAGSEFDASDAMGRKPSVDSQRQRRGSSNSTSGSTRRKKLSSFSGQGGLGPAPKRLTPTTGSSRPTTPKEPSPLAMEEAVRPEFGKRPSSAYSKGSDKSIKREEKDSRLCVKTDPDQESSRAPSIASIPSVGSAESAETA